MQSLLLQMMEGTITSLRIFFLTLIFSLPLGQLIFFYFAPFYLFGTSYDRFTACILAFVINYSAYFSEIYRSGLQSIDRGQYEAAKVLGFSKAYTFFHIILPQVVKKVLPALGNEVITLVKDTALAQTIGVAELFRVAQTASSREFSTVPIFIAGIFYFVMNYIVSRLFAIGESTRSPFNFSKRRPNKTDTIHIITINSIVDDCLKRA